MRGHRGVSARSWLCEELVSSSTDHPLRTAVLVHHCIRLRRVLRWRHGSPQLPRESTTTLAHNDSNGGLMEAHGEAYAYTPKHVPTHVERWPHGGSWRGVCIYT